MKKREQYTNARNQYTQLTQDVFEQEFPGGTRWYTSYHQKSHTDVVLSGDQWCLDTLEGEEQGILHPGLRRDHMQTLNISNNRLTSIECLNTRENRQLAFRSLTGLNAAKNMLTNVRLELHTLTVLNLAHNELRNIPSMASLLNLQKLNLAHNHIDGSLHTDEEGGMGLQKLTKLFWLDLSHNEFSWRPSAFKTQLEVLKYLPSLLDLKLESNPFAERFKEYQFITVAQLEGLKKIDGKELDRHVKNEIRKRANQMEMDGPIDFDVFDTIVKDRGSQILATHGGEREVELVPHLSELIKLLERAMDMPDQVVVQIEEFGKRVETMWKAHIWDRQRLMPGSDRLCFQYFRGHCNNPQCHDGHGNIEEWQSEVAEFGDKLGQVLQRFDSVQKILVMCLVRMLACGNSLLANRCAELLADWVEAASADLRDRVGEMSEALFGDMRERLLKGVQSINDDPEKSRDVEMEVQKMSEKERTQWMDLDQNKQRWPIDANAEAACILEALGRFVTSMSHVKSYSPFRSQVLQPFLVALCRDSHDRLGKEKPAEVWSDYAGFTTMLRGSAGKMVCARTEIQACKERCIKHNWGGFVTCELDDQPGMMEVHFKDMSPVSLSGLRQRVKNDQRAHHMLWTRPVGKDREPKSLEPCNIGSDAWRGWLSGLAVLVAGTFHNHNAALCIERYRLHERVVELEACQIFEDIEDYPEARLAFVQLMQLALNLARASGEKGLSAKVFFKDKRLHQKCWKRALKYWEWERCDDRSLLVSSLISVVCCMGESPMPESDDAESTQGPTGSPQDASDDAEEWQKPGENVKQVSEEVMRDLKAGGIDLYYLMVDLSVQPKPDPLLFASSLELIFTFLDSDVTLNFVVERTMVAMKHGSVLVPYIRGRKIKGEANMRYGELWKKCELLYPLDVSIKERMPELVSTEKKHQFKWFDMVPELARLTNPLMHRVLIGIVKLFDLFGREADSNASLAKANAELDGQGREDMLIGPATGLVTCPDWDVKLQCLRCIKNIVIKSVDQIEMNEMGTLMRYLTPDGMGVGQQEDFLMMVLEIIIRLVEDNSSTGQLFRDRFAKNAIRESFDMLQVNARRDVAGAPDEEMSKTLLSCKICSLLKACSIHKGTALRRFMRRADMLQVLKDVVKLEDSADQPGCRQQLLRTWTGRQIPDVLLPLATHDELDKWRAGRYLVYTRVADVLAGKRDYREPNKEDNNERQRVVEVETTNERYDWPSLFSMRKQVLSGIASDPVEEDDWSKQQKAFVDAHGCRKLVTSAESFCDKVEYKGRFSKASQVVGAMVEEASHDIEKWWGTVPEESDAGRARKVKDAAEVSQLEVDIQTRLTSINERVMRIFGYNLRVIDEHEKKDSISLISGILAKVIEDNMKRAKAHRDKDPAEFWSLQNSPNMLRIGGKLQETSYMSAEDLAWSPRQKSTNLEEIIANAEQAHKKLKKDLLSNTESEARKRLDAWATSNVDSSGGNDRRKGPAGLGKFLSSHGAMIVDVAIPTEELVRSKSYKYKNDWTRVRNMSRLVIEYPTAKQLLASLKAMKENSPLNMQKIRNRFLKPSSLGQHYIVVYVEVPLEGSAQSYICELKMVLNDGKEDSELRLDRMKKELEEILRENCQVHPKEAKAVMEYLIYVLDSRSVRNGDTVRLMSERARGKYMEVAGTEVFAQDTSHKRENLWVIERKEGIGCLESGDVVSIKSLRTDRYLDVAGNWVVRCRNTNPDFQEQGRTRFEVEVEHVNKSKGRGGLLGGAGKEKEVLYGKNVHPEDKIKFKVKNTKKYLALVPTKTGNDRFAVKGQEPDPEAYIEFVVHPYGSLHMHVSLDDSGTSGANAGGKPTGDVQKEQLLAEIHMCAKPPVPPSDVGGQFRKANPEWRTIAWRQAKGKSGFGGTGYDFNADEFDEKGRLGMLLAASMRSAYAVIELPRESTAREKIVKSLLLSHPPGAEQIVDHLKRSLPSRLLALVLAEQTQEEDEEQEPDVTSAWLSAKLLRLFSAVLAYAPSTMQQEGAQKEVLDKNELAEEAVRQSSGFYDRQRILLLCVLMKYVDHVLKSPMQGRLRQASSRNLDMAEVVLLYEFVNIINNVVVSFLENECRWAPPQPSGALRDKGVLASPGATVDRMGCLSKHERMQIFISMIPPTTLKLLVHVLLFSMHQEAVYFQRPMHQTSQDKDAKPTDARHMSSYPRRLSSLIDRCIDSVAAIMYCTDGQSGLDDVDYHVCTAISQAMSTGTQVVPRARVSQLMHERAIDKLRNQVRQKIDAGELKPFFYDRVGADGQPWEDPQTKTEGVCVIGLAWTSVLDPGLGDSQQLSRRLVIITSRMNFVVFALPPFYGGAVGLPDANSLTVVSCRRLEELGGIEVWRRMRQCLVLHWRTPEGDEDSKEALIFESSGRRRAFQRFLRRLPAHPKMARSQVSQPRLGVTQMRIRKHVRAILENHTVPQTSHRPCPPVDLFFVNDISVDEGDGEESMTFGDAFTEIYGAEPKVFVLDLLSVTTITVRSFLKALAVALPDPPGANDDDSIMDYEDGVLDDTDSDDDFVPKFYDGGRTLDAYERVKMAEVRGMNQQQLKKLDGVVFLAEAEPKVRLQFGKKSKMLFSFMSDGERQRFRRRLAHVILAGQQAGDKEEEDTKGWSVLPTVEKDMTKVKSAVDKDPRAHLLQIEP